MLKSGKNVGAEASIPHMVITSAEGEDEEIQLEVNGISPVDEPPQHESVFEEQKNSEPVDGHSTMQHSPVIRSDEHKGHDASSQNVDSYVQSTIQRPLVMRNVESPAIIQTESIYEIIEPKDRVLEQINGTHSDGPSDVEISKFDRKSQDRKHAEQPQTSTPEIAKESDSFFAKSKAFIDDMKPHFSFPKFPFGGKDHKKHSKDIVVASEPHSSAKAKENVNTDKSKQQEYSLETAEELSYIDHVVEHYKKIDEDAFTPPYWPEPSVREAARPVVPTGTMKTDVTTRPIRLAPEEPCELFLTEQSKQSSSSKKQSKGNKRNTEKRASTPESLYDTCCIRLAVLLRNKALEIATDKVHPPKKPPKPTAEALAKARADIAAKKLREYESKPHAFGHDMAFGFGGFQYADEDTESSTDYKDLENLGIVSNPECYGIIRKMKDDDNFRSPSTCSGVSSYYTADTATLKDENSSNNTLETVSLGSYESVICKPLSFDNKSALSSQTGFPMSYNDDGFQQHTMKKVPPPVPPKPTIVPVLPVSKSGDISRCVNTLSLSPRPVLRSTGSSAGIRKRPLTIASVKETDFSEFPKNNTFNSLPKKPVLNTVVRNNTLQNVRRLPSEPTKYPSLQPLQLSKSLPLDFTPLKPPPPPRPPPPAITPSSQAAAKKAQTFSDELRSAEEIIPPPRRIPLKHHVSPARPTPPSKPVVAAKPSTIPPPRPPPPTPRACATPSSVTMLDSKAIADKTTDDEMVKPQAENAGDIVSDVDALGEPRALTEDKELTEQTLQSETVISSMTSNNREEESLPSSNFEPVEGPSILSRHSPITCNTEGNLIEKISTNDLVLLSNVDISTPKAPPRGRRKRSRTAEAVRHRDEIPPVKRRSQSLTDLDIEKRVASLTAPQMEKPDPKSLYTVVNKDRTKNILLNIDKDHGRRSPSTDSMSSRPLPPPPPPPRSKSHSASHRSKSDERPSSADYLSSSTSSITKADSMPTELNGELGIKPPARKNKNTKQMFFSLRGKGKEKKHDSPTKFHTIEKMKPITDGYDVPIKPGRRVKPPPEPVIQFDENANIAIPTSEPVVPEEPPQQPRKSPPPALPPRHRGQSMNCDKTRPVEFSRIDKLNRSQSERVPRKHSHSSWYDEDEIDGLIKTRPQADVSPDSWEIVDWSSNDNVKVQSQEELRGKREAPPRTKKIRQTSRFYVNVDEAGNSFCAQSASPLPPMEDKETSPLRLDCSEKSVQTSLETLSIGVASRDEASDDTDDLLDLAQTLQNELKTIITRHKTAVENQSAEDSGGSEHSGLAYDSSNSALKPSSILQHQDVLPHNSTSSAASEVWQISSSDDSEGECPAGEEANLSLTYQAKKKKKIFYIAQEIMTSERAFVNALKLLNVDFREFVNEASRQKGIPVVPDDMLNQILNHLPQLQHLNENLLMELEDRINNWDKVNRIADVIVKMGPFLKLYSWYIQDFEATTTVLEEARKKYALFGQVIREFEFSAKCKRLTLNHYMLKPVQRIPQYRLLLQEYLHQLSEDCEDYEPTQEALRIVSEVANHANESMKQGDNFQKLISIQSSILGHKEIIKPGRTFIREGELMKLSRRGMQPRWFVLLNDLLLYLTQVQQGLYRVNHELMLAGMKVAIPIQPDYQNEFSIISVTRSFTLAAKSQEERQEWIVALTKAIEENASKRSTFTAVRLQQNAQKTAESVDEDSFVLGKQAPVWIPDTRVTMCQLCTSEFTVTFRRHHCRACGKVICSICSSNRISLPYLGNRIARVCDECYVKLGQGSSGCTESGETDSDNQQIAVKPHLRTDQRYTRKPKRNLPSVLKEVCANDQGSTLSGYINRRNHKNWKRNWFVIKDKVLYEYRASEDVAALRSIPLLGFQINTFSEPLEGIDACLLFELTHPGQAPIIFHAETPGSAERWIKTLREATVLE